MILSDADKVLLTVGRREYGLFHLLTEWYIGGVPMPKQYAFHQAWRPNVTWVGSIASGKSWGISASVLADCLTLPYFRALSTSITSVQAEIPFEMVNAWITSDAYRPRIEHLIDDIVKRPYPTIKFKNGSSWLFRTVGIQATHIRGLEFDRIVFDEAGYESDESTLTTLRGRLRGERMPGVPRMARLDVATSPTDAPWLRKWFDWGNPSSIEPRLRDYLSIRSTIYDNVHITTEQIRLMKAGYSDEMIRVELEGEFPEYGETLFAQRHIREAEDPALNDEMELALRPETGSPLPGYRQDVHPRHGIVYFERPMRHGHIYVQAGDPGMGDVPSRNAGCIMVYDVTTKPYELVYFHWVSGRGSYMPFLNSFKYAMEVYAPVLSGLDATGPQAAMDELAFQNFGIEIERINFNRDKDAALNSLSFLLTNHQLKHPFIKGMHIQLSKYVRNDKGLDNDIVVTLAMIAHLAMQSDEPANYGTRARSLRRPRYTRPARRSSFRRH